MNAKLFKHIFSKRLNTLVVVGENCTADGKQAGVSPSVGVESNFSDKNVNVYQRFLGLLSLGFVCVNTVFADPASDALPVNGVVAQGAASIAQQANQMTINQTTDKAVINWQGFDIGSTSTVNVIQPSSQSVLLNRVVGNNPSQIFGSLNANGHVILVNPNGIVFGADGSVTASAFTASTLGISDADFMAGNFHFVADGSNGTILNQGAINTKGGYVALLGATVTNDGKITTNQGNVYMAAAKAITVPVTRSGRIKMELDPASINAAVNNTQKGLIVTSGGQVLMQAAALNDAIAKGSVTNAGQINTAGVKGGDVNLLSDGGVIRVSGNIEASSTEAGKAGGQIIIGRDLETGVLSASTDASGAVLKTKDGFIETSGDFLKTDDIKITAKTWLLDPVNIEINTTGTAATSGNSVVKTGDIENALEAGTSVIIATGTGSGSTSSATGVSETVTATTQGRGIIYVNDSILKDAGGDASLTLNSNADITIAAGKTIRSTAGKLDVIMNANLGGDGGGIIFNTGSGITTNGGNLSLTGGGAATGSVLTHAGVLLTNATLDATGLDGGHINVTGTSNTNAPSTAAGGSSGSDGVRVVGGGAIKTSGLGNITINGTNPTQSAPLTKGVVLSDVKITGGSSGLISITGDSSTSTTSSLYIYGVLVNGATEITSTGASINMTGLGGGGSGSSYNQGIEVSGSAKIAAGGMGTVTLTGTGGTGTSGNNWGVYMGGGTVASLGGAISIIGAGGAVTSNNFGVYIAGTTTVGGLSSAPITITTDSVVLGSTANINSGTGLTTIQNRTAGTLINVGGADNLTPTTGTRTLGVSDAEINRVTAGTLKIGSLTSGNTRVSGAVDTIAGSAITGNLYLLSGGTLTASAAVTSEKGLYLQTQGGAITTSAALSGTNVSIDNTASAIDLTTGAINQQGSSTSGTFAAITIGGNITASENLNLYGVSGSQIGINVLASQVLSGGNIQATGKTGRYYAVLLNNGAKVTTTGTSGVSNLNAIHNFAGDGGIGALTLLGANELTAAAGTRLELTGNTTGIAATSHLNTRGVRIEGAALNTSGDITITGNSSSSNGLLVLGSGINVLSGSLGLNGTMTSNGGAGGLGAAIDAPIKLSNNTSLNITGHAANRSTTTGPETGLSITGIISQAAGSATAGNIRITGSSSTGSNSIGVNIAAAVSTGAGNIHIVGQNLANSTGSSVGIGASITSSTGNVAIQSIGGVISQTAGTIRGKNISIDNTGAGLVSLINNGVVATGTAMGGSIDSSTGSITAGSGVASIIQAGINIVGGINAAGNINLYGTNNGGSGIYIGGNITTTLGDANITGISGANTVGLTTPDSGLRSAAIVSAKNINLVANATNTSGNVLGYYGASGSLIASEQLTLSGSSANNGNGFYSIGGAMTAGTGITIAGTSANGQGVGLDANVTLMNAAGNVVITGTADDASKQAIGLRGSRISNSNGVTRLVAAKGNLVSDSVNGAGGNWGVEPAGQPLLNIITHSGTGAVEVTAGALAADASGIDGKALTINQGGNDGVLVQTSGTGNVTAPKIANTGNGNVVLAAGALLAAGDATGGQVLTQPGNSISSGGKTFIYSGSVAGTGNLSVVDSSFNNLALAGSGLTTNAQLNSAFGATIAGGANTQVLFRQSALPNVFDLSLSNISKEYGSADLTGSALISALSAAYTANSGASTLTKVTGNNTFAMLASTAFDGLNVSAATRTAGENVNSGTPYAYSGMTNNNAIVAVGQPGLVITPKALSITANAISGIYSGATYDALATAAGFTSDGLVNATINGFTINDSISAVESTFKTGSTIGSGTAITGSGAAQAGDFNRTIANASGTGLENYTISYIGNTGSIAKANATVTGNSLSTTYTGLAQSVTGFTVSGLVNNETAAVLTGVSATGATGTDAGTYTNTVSHGTATNYNLSFTNGALTIAKAPITIALDNKTTTYGSITPLTFSVSGLVNSETATTAGISISAPTTTGFITASITNNVGNYAITTTTNPGNANYTNYTLTSVTNGNLDITPATLTFTVQDASKLVTKADPTLSYSVSGLVNGDSASAYTGPSISRASGETADKYAITLSGGSASNYNIVRNDGIFSIIGADKLLITMAPTATTYGTLGASVVTKAEYAKKDANNSLVTFFNLTNIGNNVWSDGVGGSITITPTLTGVSVNSNVGTYANAVTNTNTDIATSSGNFISVATQEGNYVVNPAALTISASNITRTYDGSTFSVGSATATGFMNGEGFATLGGLSFTGDAIDRRDAGTYSYIVTANGNPNGNYAITYQGPAQLLIEPKQLTVSNSVAANKVIDGNTNAIVTVGSLNGLVGNETLGVTATGEFNDASAGTNKPVRTTYTLVDGENGGRASNYKIFVEFLRASIFGRSNPVTGGGNANNRPFVNPVIPTPIVPIDVAPEQQVVSTTVTSSSASTTSTTANAVDVKLANSEKPLAPEQCSAEIHSERCDCQKTLFEDVMLCKVSQEGAGQASHSSKKAKAHSNIN